MYIYYLYISVCVQGYIVECGHTCYDFIIGTISDMNWNNCDESFSGIRYTRMWA